jgi:hypothetical protein
MKDQTMADVTVKYTGGPMGVSALAQMLRAEGVTVTYEAPQEKRSAEQVVEAVVVYVACKGADAAIAAALAKFRQSRFGGTSTAETTDE